MIMLKWSKDENGDRVALGGDIRITKPAYKGGLWKVIMRNPRQYLGCYTLKSARTAAEQYAAFREGK